MILVIGVAMLAFIATDLLQGLVGIRGSVDIGEVYGDDVDAQDFSNLYQKNLTFQGNPGDAAKRQQVYQASWEEYVRRKIYEHEFESDGIVVTDAELYRLFLLPEESPSIFQQFDQIPAFKDSTGQFNYQAVKQFINQANAIEEVNTQEERRLKEFVADLENFVYYTRIQDKFRNLAKAPGTLVSANEARYEHQNREKKFDISFLMVDYTSVSDSAVEVNDGDIRDHINARPKKFKQEEQVAIRYVIFPKVPLAQDSNRALENLQRLAPQFESAENDTQFIAGITGQMFDTIFKSRDILPVKLAAEFADTVEKGQVVGPMLDGTIYKLWKVLNVRPARNASAKLRHIQFNYSGGTAADSAEVRQKARNVRNILLADRSKFEQMAADTSEDVATNTLGGEMGWSAVGGSYGPYWDDAMQKAAVGDIYLTESNSGYHIVEVLAKDENEYQIGEITEEIFPGDKTVSKLYNEAKQVAREVRQAGGLEAYADKDSTARVIVSQKLDKSKFELQGVQGGLGILHWAFGAEEGEFADRIFSTDDAFVLAEVAAKYEEGTQKVDDVRETVDRTVRNRKKADAIVEKLNSVYSNNLEKIRDGYGEGAQILTATDVSFSSPSVTGIGADNWIIGKITGMVQDEISKPIIGDAGVFIIRIDAVKEAPELDEATLESERTNVTFTKGTRLENGIYTGLLKLADVKDWRYENSIFLDQR